MLQGGVDIDCLYNGLNKIWCVFSRARSTSPRVPVLDTFNILHFFFGLGLSACPPAEHLRTRRGGAGGGAQGLRRGGRLQVWTDQDEVRHGRLPRE